MSTPDDLPQRDVDQPATPPSQAAQSGVDQGDVSQNPERPTDEWVTGDEPMTGPQQSYLTTLAQEAGEHAKSGLTKAQASKEIERLQRVTGRGA